MMTFLKYFLAMTFSGFVAFAGMRTFKKHPASAVHQQAVAQPAVAAVRPAEVFASDLPPTASSHHSAVKSHRVRVSLANETSSSNHSFDGTLDLIDAIVLEEEPLFMSKGVRKIILRPVWSEQGYVELLALSKQNEIVGSFLMKESLTTHERYLRQVLGSMWTSNTQANTSGRLVISDSAQNRSSRAYINGFPLQRAMEPGAVVFNLRLPAHSDVEELSLAVTGDEQPLVRAGVQRSELGRTLHWTLPFHASNTQAQSHVARVE